MIIYIVVADDKTPIVAYEEYEDAKITVHNLFGKGATKLKNHCIAVPYSENNKILNISNYSIYCNKCDANIDDLPDTEDEIVDAWNAKAERICKQEERGWGTEGDHARVWLTCGHDFMVSTIQDLPNYCPECGARIEKRDE